MDEQVGLGVRPRGLGVTTCDWIYLLSKWSVEIDLLNGRRNPKGQRRLYVPWGLGKSTDGDDETLVERVFQGSFLSTVLNLESHISRETSLEPVTLYLFSFWQTLCHQESLLQGVWLINRYVQYTDIDRVFVWGDNTCKGDKNESSKREGKKKL